MPLSHRIVRVPVRLVDGQWELFYGGAVKAKDGTIGELRIDRRNIADKALLKALTDKSAVQILNEGTELRVALTIKGPLPEPLDKHLIPYDDMKHTFSPGISGGSRFVSVYLAGPTPVQVQKGFKTGGLWLYLEGMEPRFLEAGEVWLPKVNGLEKAISLNHAFTLLSEQFEAWRLAHTGSIYERVFYQDTDKLWYPLGDLRERELASAERAIIAALWEEVRRSVGKSLF